MVLEVCRILLPLPLTLYRKTAMLGSVCMIILLDRSGDYMVYGGIISDNAGSEYLKPLLRGGCAKKEPSSDFLVFIPFSFFCKFQVELGN